MKVMFVNGSPHVKGNTFLALEEMRKVFEAEGIETELVQVGIKAVRGCIGCRKCFETLARNMTFLMKSIALGKEKFGLPEKEEWVPTNFIR